MRIGTTPTYTFQLPPEAVDVKTAKVTFRQNRTVVLEKKEECVISDKTVKVSLSQEETFLFDARYKTDVQLRVVTMGGDALSTDVYTLDVAECLDREVL